MQSLLLGKVIIDILYYHLQVMSVPEDLRHVSCFGADGDDGLSSALKAIYGDVNLKNPL